ncbi:MAG: DEAD/DEAH box helicase [Mycobacteriaceae bacterium]
MLPASPAHPDAISATFAELGVPDALLTILTRAGITVPSDIQTAAVSDALAGRNILGRAQTGSGKTLAFGLPMLARLAYSSVTAGARAQAKRPRAMVLVPTRELAFQVVDALSAYADALGLTVRPAVGGVPFGRQADQLRRGVDVLVATPGRLGDHLRQQTCFLDAVEITVLDEADQMADMGFLPEVKALLSQTAPDGQRMLFSATLEREVQVLVRMFLADHVTHATQDATASVDTMSHHVLLVDRGQKDAVLARIGAREGRTIMFARTKLGAEGITDRLREQGIAAESLHGGKAQNQRTRVLDRFKTGRTPVLVATDVAARGIHVDGISLVVHVDPPADAKDYLHRAGRTARAGEAGTVVTIVLPNQKRTVRKLTLSAGVNPRATSVSPDSAELTEITGAREPSGEPLPLQVKTAPRTGHGGHERPGARPRTGGYQGTNPRPRSDSARPRPDGGPHRTGGYRGTNPRPRPEAAASPYRSAAAPAASASTRSAARPAGAGGFRSRSAARDYDGAARPSNGQD